MSLSCRYFSRRRRRPTRSSSPRRLWWSCLWLLRCSVRSLIRRVSSATWTSGDPVSPSLVAYSAMIWFLTAVSSDTGLLLKVVTRRPGRYTDPHGAYGYDPPPHEGAAALPGTLPQAIPLYQLTRGAQSRTGTVRDLPGSVHVPVHLLDQGLDRVELQGVAEPVDEVDAHVVAVEVEILAVQRVRLDRAYLTVEGRVGADGDRRGPLLVRVAVGVADQPARVDPVGRD